MNRSIVSMADSASADGLDGQWVAILPTGTYDGETYTPDDLDGMVSEYQSRGEAAKAPVALGISAQGSSAPVGKIDALRRVKNSLQAKFAGIDPRVEHLYGRGIFPKKSVRVKRSPEGVSLQSVGLVHPVWRDYWRDNETPSLDALMKQAGESKDHVFDEGSLAGQWLELFRSGNYGDKGNFSNSDLDQIVRNFEPLFHEPPAVIGHPQQDAPAYGRIDGLRRSGDTLLGKFKQVDPKFEEMVKAGRFKKRSVSLYQTAKGWMLRHVGFLGAQPPEVKGLANASFKEDRIRFVTLVFGESEANAAAAVTRLKREGYWMREFDHFNFPAVFTELEGSSALSMLVSFLERLQDDCGVDRNDEHLSSRAQSFARFHGVSFTEALDSVQKQESQAAASQRAVDAGLPQARLSQLAYEVMHSRGVSFAEALTEVAAENPELTW